MTEEQRKNWPDAAGRAEEWAKGWCGPEEGQSALDKMVRGMVEDAVFGELREERTTLSESLNSLAGSMPRHRLVLRELASAINSGSLRRTGKLDLDLVELSDDSLTQEIARLKELAVDRTNLLVEQCKISAEYRDLLERVRRASDAGGALIAEIRKALDKP